MSIQCQCRQTAATTTIECVLVGFKPNRVDNCRVHDNATNAHTHAYAHVLHFLVSLGGSISDGILLLQSIDPLGSNLVFLLEVDHVVEILERPRFRQFISTGARWQPRTILTRKEAVPFLKVRAIVFCEIA
jgi:hypothetical protein